MSMQPHHQPHQLSWVHPGKHRYYQAYLTQDLFGDWALRTVWGGVGSRRGRVRNTGVASYEDGLAQIREIEKRRAQRGYAAVASS